MPWKQSDLWWHESYCISVGVCSAWTWQAGRQAWLGLLHFNKVRHPRWHGDMAFFFKSCCMRIDEVKKAFLDCYFLLINLYCNLLSNICSLLSTSRGPCWTLGEWFQLFCEEQRQEWSDLSVPKSFLLAYWTAQACSLAAGPSLKKFQWVISEFRELPSQSLRKASNYQRGLCRTTLSRCRSNLVHVDGWSWEGRALKQLGTRGS